MNYFVIPGIGGTVGSRETAKRKLKPFKRRIKTPKEIFNTVCGVFELKPSDVMGDSREKELVLARQYYCLFSREMTNRSNRIVGEYINRDHSTVIYAVKNIKGLIETNNEECARYYDIRHEFMLDADIN